jgi:hypothetical protein
MAGGDRPIQRIGDANDAGAATTNGDGNSTVYANNILVNVNGSSVVPHLPDNAHSGVVTANGSSNVFAHNVSINFTDNPDSCGHVRIGGSSDVFVGDSVDQDTPPNREINDSDEEDAVNPGGGAVRVAAAVAAGTLSAAEVAAGSTPVVGTIDASTGTNAGVVISNDCSDIDALFPSVAYPSVVAPTGDAIDAITLSTNYTVGRMTRKPYVTFDHALRAGTGGLTLQEIICNLKMLAINVVEPVRAQYSNMFLTNTWRPLGDKASTSQHPKGMACDMQFKGIAKADYFAIAQWCRDNLVYDQLLLEYKTTGSGLPWIHISFNKNNNRKQVLTFMNNKTFAQGLKDLSKTNA